MMLTSSYLMDINLTQVTIITPDDKYKQASAQIILTSRIILPAQIFKVQSCIVERKYTS